MGKPSHTCRCSGVLFVRHLYLECEARKGTIIGARAVIMM